MDEQASGDLPRAASGQRHRPGAVGHPCDSNSGAASRREFAVEDAPDPDELAFLEERVSEATRASAGVADDLDLAIFVRDEDGRVLAGVSGGNWGGCCELQHLWVDEALASQGLGSARMSAAEDEARRRGCTDLVLLTDDVQAPGFYERLGFETVGVVEGYPNGSAARRFRKRLSTDTPADDPERVR